MSQTTLIRDKNIYNFYKVGIGIDHLCEKYKLKANTIEKIINKCESLKKEYDKFFKELQEYLLYDYSKAVVTRIVNSIHRYANSHNIISKEEIVLLIRDNTYIRGIGEKSRKILIKYLDMEMNIDDYTECTVTVPFLVAPSNDIYAHWDTDNKNIITKLPKDAVIEYVRKMNAKLSSFTKGFYKLEESFYLTKINTDDEGWPISANIMVEDNYCIGDDFIAFDFSYYDDKRLVEITGLSLRDGNKNLGFYYPVDIMKSEEILS